MLLEFGNIFYFDASIRFRTSNISAAIQHALMNRGILSFLNAGHSNWAVTHEKMYEYLPVDIDLMKQYEQHESGAFIMMNTKWIQENVMIWFVLCSLEKDCIAPTTQQECLFEGDPYQRHANCHRYDQSALNILVSNHIRPERWKFDEEGGKFLEVERWVTKNFTIKTC